MLEVIVLLMVFREAAAMKLVEVDKETPVYNNTVPLQLSLYRKSTVILHLDKITRHSSLISYLHNKCIDIFLINHDNILIQNITYNVEYFHIIYFKKTEHLTANLSLFPPLTLVLILVEEFSEKMEMLQKEFCNIRRVFVFDFSNQLLSYCYLPYQQGSFYWNVSVSDIPRLINKHLNLKGYTLTFGMSYIYSAYRYYYIFLFHLYATLIIWKYNYSAMWGLREYF